MKSAEGFVMEYWVYEHWTAEHKAVIHSATRGFCNHGRGTNKRKPRGDANGKWHGRYHTLADADTAARRTGRPMCRHI